VAFVAFGSSPLKNTHYLCTVFGLVSFSNGADSLLLKVLQEPVCLDNFCKKRGHENKNVARFWAS
jgi:hypothetical protein